MIRILIEIIFGAVIIVTIGLMMACIAIAGMDTEEKEQDEE